MAREKVTHADLLFGAAQNDAMCVMNAGTHVHYWFECTGVPGLTRIFATLDPVATEEVASLFGEPLHTLSERSWPSSQYKSLEGLLFDLSASVMYKLEVYLARNMKTQDDLTDAALNQLSQRQG